MSNKPVEIDILMRDRASAVMKDVGQAATAMGETFEQAADTIKAKMEEQRELIRYTEGELKKLEAQLKGMAPGKGWVEMKAEVDACRKALEEERVALAYTKQQYDEATSAGRRYTTQLRETQDAMARMRLEGKQTTPEYAALEQKASDLAYALDHVRKQTNVLAHDNAGLQGVISGVSGLTGGITAAVGVMGVFTRNNEDLVKIQTKVQSVMAITMGLQQVMNALNKDSAFRLVTLRAVKEGLIAANTRLAVSLGISNVAAQALMATLTLGLSVAIGAIIVMWDKFSSKQAAARAELEEFNKKVADIAGPSVANFKKMVAEWENLGDSLEAKEKYVRDNQDAFHDLGVEVNNVAEADNLFADQTKAFIGALNLRAQATAAFELASEKYKVAVEKMMEAEQLPATQTRYTTYADGSIASSYEVKSPRRTKLEKDAEEARREGDKYLGMQRDYTQQAADKMAEADIETAGTIVEGSVAALEKVIEGKRELLKKATNAVDYQRILGEIKAKERELAAITGGKDGNGGGGSADSTASLRTRLAEAELRTRRRIEDQALALRQEGYDKERAAAALNFQREKERIEKEERERLALYDKLRASGANVDPAQQQTIVDQATQQMTQATNLYNQAIAGINKKQEEDQKETLDELLEPYKTYAEKRLDIEKKYFEITQQLSAAGASAENIANANAAKDRELAELDNTMGSTTDFFARLFDSFSDYTNKELQAIIDNAREVLDYLNTTPTEQIVGKFGLSAEQLKELKGNAADLKTIYDALGDKIQQLNNRNPFTAIIRSQQMLRQNADAIRQAEEELAAAQASGDKAAIHGAQQRLDGLKRQEALLKGSLKDAVKAAIDYLGDIGDAFQKIGEASGDAGLASFGKTLGELAGIAGQFASGDIIGGTISAITTGLTAIFSSKAKYRAALKQMQDDQIAFAHAYKMAMYDIRLEAEEASNAFGEDTFKKATTALGVLKDSYQDFIALVNKDDTIRGGDSIFDRFRKARLEAQGITTDLQNIWIQTRNKTWFRSAKGKYLKDLYPDLFEGEYGFNDKAARSLLETNNQLNDEAKRQLQEVIDMYDKWKEAEEAFKSYLNETFGEVGNALGDSIVGAFKDGSDAMESWGKSFDKVLENLGKQLMYTMFFKDYFDQLHKDVQASYEIYGDDPNALGAKMQSILSGFFSGMSGTVEEASAWYEQWAEMARQNGFDLSSTDGSASQQSGQAGAFTTMSQDQAYKLEGLFTSVQMRLGDILLKMDDVGPGIGEACSFLAEISENTRSSSVAAAAILGKIEQIIREGIKVQ